MSDEEKPQPTQDVESPAGDKVAVGNQSNSDSVDEGKSETSEKSKDEGESEASKKSKDGDKPADKGGSEASKKSKDKDKPADKRESEASKKSKDKDKPADKRESETSKKTKDDDKSADTEKPETSKKSKDDDKRESETSKKSKDDDKPADTEKPETSKKSKDDDKPADAEKPETSKKTKDDDKPADTEKPETSKKTKDDDKRESETSKKTKDDDKPATTDQTDTNVDIVAPSISLRHIYGVVHDSESFDRVSYVQFRPLSSHLLALSDRYVAIPLKAINNVAVYALNDVQGKMGDTATPLVVFKGPAKVAELVFALSDQNLLAVGYLNGDVLIWRVEESAEPKPVAIMSGNNRIGCVKSLTFCHWSKSLLAIGGRLDSGIIWDYERDKVVKIPKHPKRIASISWARGDQGLLTTAEDKTIRLWNLETKTVTSEIELACRNPFSRIVAVGTKRQTGSYFVTASVNDSNEREIILWDALEKKVIGKFAFHTSGVAVYMFYDPDTDVVIVAERGGMFVRVVGLEWDEKAAKYTGISFTSLYTGSTVIVAVAMAPKTAVDPYSCEVLRLVVFGGTKLFTLHFIVDRRYSETYFMDFLFPPTIDYASLNHIPAKKGCDVLPLKSLNTNGWVAFSSVQSHLEEEREKVLDEKKKKLDDAFVGEDGEEVIAKLSLQKGILSSSDDDDDDEYGD